MGHIVLAAPDIERFLLVERLSRELVSRGHRVSVLCLDPVGFTFWSTQGLEAVSIEPGAPAAGRAPLSELAETDCLRRARPAHGRALDRARHRLARLLPGLLRWFEAHAPDLVLLHQRRTGAHRLVHFVARETGCRTLWTGAGLLPHTLQHCTEGIDGDARICRRTAWDFRGVDVDAALLDAALAAVVSRSTPPALSRRMLQVPPLGRRLRDAAAALAGRHGYGVLGALDAWQRAAAADAEPDPTDVDLPGRPFVAVLLQGEADPRLRLDASSPPSAPQLVRAVRAAARRIDTATTVVAVLPAHGLLARDLAALRRLEGVKLERACGTIDACLAAMAVITVNAPGAAIALLAETPTVHLGRAPYGIPGVATQARLDTLPGALAEALAADEPLLRRRFLTWTLAHGHVWCSPALPDHNGLNGLLMVVERLLDERGPYGAQLHYRAGPAWPLAADSRS